MKRAIHILYLLCVGCVLVLIFCLCVGTKDEVFERRGDQGYRKLTEYESREREDKGAPFGIRTEYTMQVNGTGEGSCLMFQTLHQNVEVWIQGNPVYSLNVSEDNWFGRTPGNNWNIIPIYPGDNGKKITVILTPVYEETRNSIPEFYLGSRFNIYGKIIRENILSLVLSVAAIFAGLIFIFFTLYNWKNAEVDKSLLMMGMFALFIGIWQLFDMGLTALVLRHIPAVSYIPFCMLLLVMVPFVLFFKEMFSTRESVVWYLLCAGNLLISFVSLALQVFGIADFRQTLWLNHIGMAALVVVAFSMLFYELCTAGWNHELKIMAVCMCACLLGMLADLSVYYLTDTPPVMVMGMVGFLAYIIILGARTARKAKRLMAIGVKAKHYEKMAYFDQLTGVYNRAAYMEYVQQKEETTEKSVVFMCDLNNLKKCNDTRGHEKSDRYLIESARLIQQTFQENGKCCRIGGDEFCILVSGISEEECGRKVAELNERVREYNQKNPGEFPVQIACGYEAYNSQEDYDLRDTMRRADKKMYLEKLRMKEKNRD
ncbi:MAG: diguanylate cyclase [Clostridiales bacterium]|nr:diguanylate cyclase [Clostridiales bacterium]